MKTKLTIIFALALVASAFFYPTVCNAYSPWDVTFSVCFNGDTYFYRLSDNLDGYSSQQLQDRGVYLSLNAKRLLFDELQSNGFTLEESLCYVLPGINTVLQQIRSNQVQRRDATVRFCPNDSAVFYYQQGQDGIQADIKGLVDTIFSGKAVFDCPILVDKAVTVQDLKQVTKLRSTFYTTFVTANVNRAKNLGICADKISGVVLQPHEKFSFNTVVGERTEANGFLPAKQIREGTFVDGVGGGVCQVSGTLYNAVLLADLRVTALYQHSLVSTYVEPSFDAMVSYPSADFCFVNSTEHPLYVSCFVKGNRLTVSLYGEPCPYQILRESVVLERTPPTVETVICDQDDAFVGDSKVLTNGSDYVKSSGYLVYKRGNTVVKRVKIRQNEYKMAKKVVLVKK